MFALTEFVLKMHKSSRVKPIVNVITVGNVPKELNTPSFTGDNFSETRSKIPFGNTLIYKEIQLLIISLKLCGLFPIHGKRCSVSSLLWQFHHFFVFSLMVLNLLRSLSTFDPKDGLGPIFFMKIQWTIWSLENFTKIVVFWVGFKKCCRIPLLFLKQDKLIRQCLECLGNFHRIVVSMFVLTILLPALNVLFHIVCHLVSPSLSELQFSSRWPSFLKNSLTFWLKLIIDLPIVYLNSAICTTAACFFCFMCYLIVKNLNNLRISIEKVTLDGFLTEDLAHYRYRFQELCDVIATLDCSFTYIIFLTLLAGIPLFCVIFYQAIYFSNSVDESAFFGILLIALIVYMSLFLLLPAWINSEVRQLKILFYTFLYYLK